MRNNGEWKILHCFADEGVESEVLDAFGTVYRVGLNPEKNRYSHAIKADGGQVPFEGETFDLSVWHPPCQPFSVATPKENRGNYDNYIPIAREQAREISEYYIIENVPNAPLRDPIKLNGKMFGLDITYERAFETNYHVPQPPIERSISKDTNFSEDQGKAGWEWIGSKYEWALEKGYSTKWSAESLKKTTVPRPYLKWLLAPLLDEDIERTIPESQQRRANGDQSELGVW